MSKWYSGKPNNANSYNKGAYYTARIQRYVPQNLCWEEDHSLDLEKSCRKASRRLTNSVHILPASWERAIRSEVMSPSTFSWKALELWLTSSKITWMWFHISDLTWDCTAPAAIRTLLECSLISSKSADYSFFEIHNLTIVVANRSCPNLQS